ncbi:hypothetical protein K438DRAFT_2021538, partial [Mycena galopus ATCC 62051]
MEFGSFWTEFKDRKSESASKKEDATEERRVTQCVTACSLLPPLTCWRRHLGLVDFKALKLFFYIFDGFTSNFQSANAVSDFPSPGLVSTPPPLLSPIARPSRPSDSSGARVRALAAWPWALWCGALVLSVVYRAVVRSGDADAECAAARDDHAWCGAGSIRDRGPSLSAWGWRFAFLLLPTFILIRTSSSSSGCSLADLPTHGKASVPATAPPCKVPSHCPPKIMGAEYPFFILYVRGSTSFILLTLIAHFFRLRAAVHTGDASSAPHSLPRASCVPDYPGDVHGGYWVGQGVGGVRAGSEYVWTTALEPGRDSSTRRACSCALTGASGMTRSTELSSGSSGVPEFTYEHV